MGLAKALLRLARVLLLSLSHAVVSRRHTARRKHFRTLALPLPQLHAFQKHTKVWHISWCVTKPRPKADKKLLRVKGG